MKKISQMTTALNVSQASMHATNHGFFTSTKSSSVSNWSTSMPAL